jgi:dCTP deaminase
VPNRDPYPSFGILPDYMIQFAVEDGVIEIDPFNPENLNPVSYDLTLGDEVVVYKRWVGYVEHYDDTGPMGLATSRAMAAGARDGTDLYRIKTERYLDVKEEPETVKFKIDSERGWVLQPGIGYLMCTRERVFTKKYVPVLDGKSSIGRLFMVVHVTAGFGDPNFNGQYTLEVTVTHPLKVYAGMKIAQMRFHTIAGDPRMVRMYDGNYTGDAAKGPVASRAYRQFLPDDVKK